LVYLLDDELSPKARFYLQDEDSLKRPA
jgi:hypothetical protein